MLVGLFVFVLSVALLVGPALFAGRFAAKHFGLPGFCLFDVKPKGTLVRELAVFAVATAAPLLVCCSLIALSAFVAGQSTGSNRVDVVSGGTAEVAGIVTGDRIVSVDGTATANFDTIRANIRRSQAPHSVTVERDGHRLELTVTPECSRCHRGNRHYRASQGHDLRSSGHGHSRPISGLEIPRSRTAEGRTLRPRRYREGHCPSKRTALGHGPSRARHALECLLLVGPGSVPQ